MHVKVISPFEHVGTRRRGDVFEVSDKIGQALKQKGLAEIVGDPVVAERQPAVDSGGSNNGDSASSSARGRGRRSSNAQG